MGSSSSLASMRYQEDGEAAEEEEEVGLFFPRGLRRYARWKREFGGFGGDLVV